MTSAKGVGVIGNLLGESDFLLGGEPFKSFSKLKSTFYTL